MRKTRRATKLLLFIIVGILLVGCLLYGIGIGRIQYWINPPSMKNIPSVLAQAPCVANVCIGMTGRDVVFEKLSQSGLLYGINDNGGMPIGFSIREGGSGWVLFANNGWQIVSGLELRIEGVSLKSVLDAFGEPDEMFLMYGCGRGKHIHARLFYPDRGVEVEIQRQATRQERQDRGAQIALEERSPVWSVHYFDSTKYDERLLGLRESLRWSGYFVFADTVSDETLVSAIQPWPGLGVSVVAVDLCPVTD